MNFNFAIKSADNSQILTESEIKTISEQVSPVSLLPLPEIDNSSNLSGKEKHEEEVNYFSMETWLLLISTSYVVSGFLKHFLKSIAEESGKDFWKYCKKLITKIWNKQDEKIYRNHGFAYLMFPIANHFVAFEFIKPKGEQNVVIDYNPSLQKDILFIYDNLDKIESMFSDLLDKDLKEQMPNIGEFSNDQFGNNRLTKYVYIVRGFKSNHVEVTRRKYDEFMAANPR